MRPKTGKRPATKRKRTLTPKLKTYLERPSRDTQTFVRLSEEERELLTRVSGGGQPLASWCREALLGMARRIVGQVEFRQAEFRRLEQQAAQAEAKGKVGEARTHRAQAARRLQSIELILSKGREGVPYDEPAGPEFTLSPSHCASFYRRRYEPYEKEKEEKGPNGDRA